MTDQEREFGPQPPLARVTLSVIFEAQPVLATVPLSVFCNSLSQEFPLVRDSQPIVEIVDGRTNVDPMADRLFELRSAAHDLALQVQRDRFAVSWVRVPKGHDYPRFAAMLEGFLRHFATLQALLSRHGAPPPALTSAELQYVNVLRLAGGDFGGLAGSILDLPRHAEGRAGRGALTYVAHTEQRAVSSPPHSRLTIAVASSPLSSTDGGEPRTQLQFDLSVSTHSPTELRFWFDTAHAELIVADEALTTKQARTMWGQEQ